MHRFLPRILAYSLLSLSLFPLSGCDAVILGGATTYAQKKINEKPPLSLTGFSYAAADMIASQSRHSLSTKSRFETVPLQNIGQRAAGPALGRMIVEQVGSRFTQLGYDVEPDTSMLGRKEASGKKIVIGGTYAAVGSEIMVNLRLMDSANGKLIGAYDYQMPITREIRDLTGLQPEVWDFL